MLPHRFHLIAAVFIILEQDNNIFLLRRVNTGWEDGKYTLIGGHLEGNETAMQAAMREAKEEAGIIIDPKDLTFVNVNHLVTNSERIHFTFVAKRWEGEPKNNEPEKADDAQWFAKNALPENTIDIVKNTIRWYGANIIYTEYGWDKK